LKRGGYIYTSWKQGKLGVDKYLLIIGLSGAFVIPLYIYQRHKKYKEQLRIERGLKPGEQIDVENGPWDLDDLSYHKVWYNDKEERALNTSTLRRKREIRKLEEELYGKDAFGATLPKK
jgi:hypothetical protein